MAESPGFYFNVEEWRGSRSVGRMSMAERGVYLEMMIEQWLRRTLPDDAQLIAEAVAITPEQVAEVLAGWDAVRRKFITDASGRIFNVKVEQVRRKQRANQKKRQLAGQRGGKAAAEGRRNAHKEGELLASNAIATLSTAVAMHSDKRGEEGSRGEVIRTEGSRTLAPVSSRSKRPIFSGQRLTVFEWMFDDCCKTLGPLTDGFGLDEWFWSLDEQAAKFGLVIPQRDGGAWLQSQLVAEAQRRGLPVAVAGPAVGKQTTRLQAALANIKAEAS